MVSILILTHNRPKLFERCLKSILNNIPDTVEVIVNNDSNDISEIKHKQVKYFYKKSNNLSDLYKMLFDYATQEYVYFLEDDDYLIPNFWNIINNLNKDLYYMNFIPSNVSKTVPILKFKMETENNMFQLSQILFKKKCCSNFPEGNYLDNDWKLFQNVLSNCNTIKLIRVPMFVQTTDGKDNISFKEYNNDKRFL